MDKIKFFFSYFYYRWRIKSGLHLNRKGIYKTYHDKVLFVHIPKAAGISVVNYLYNTYKSSHFTAYQYKIDDPLKFEKLYKIAVVRDPVDRFASAYSYLKSNGRSVIDMVWADLYLSGYKDINDFVINGGLAHAISKKADHFRCQSDFIFFDDVKLVDKIYSFSKLCELEKDTQNVAKSASLGVLNRGIGSVPKELNAEAFELAKSLYERDYRLLGEYFEK